MIVISLNDIRMNAYHGVYSEERLVGSSYCINLQVGVPEGAVTDNIDDTLDYEVLYKIIRKEMQKPRALLETVLIDIRDAVLDLGKPIEWLEASIEKENAPLPNLRGTTSVEIFWEKEG